MENAKEEFQSDDNVIKDHINEILIDLECEHIEVSVDSGEVSLLGEVNNEETKSVIEQRVKGIPGVKKVFNELHEKSLPQ